MLVILILKYMAFGISPKVAYKVNKKLNQFACFLKIIYT
jgi:hypothetical protein